MCCTLTIACKENTDPNSVSGTTIKLESKTQHSRKVSPLGSSVDNVKAVLSQVHHRFRESLHLSEIIPALNARSLLTTEEMETLRGSAYTSQEKVDKLLLEFLPRKGTKVIQKLIESLHESKSGTGSAHAELAEMLEGD